jgi:Flp pilus assembly protein TadD
MWRLQSTCVVSDEILKKLRSEVQRRPDDVHAWLALGNTALEEGALEEARRALNRVLERVPNHPDANRALAKVMGQLGDTRSSILCWQRVVSLTGPDDFEALTMLAIALSTEGQHDRAVAILSDVAKRARTCAAHADLGMALLAARRLEEAVLAFSHAREIDPRSAQAHCGLGLVYQQQGRWWEAADAFKRTEQLAPDSPVGPMNLGVVLETLGEHQEARAALLRAAKLAPHDQEIRQALDQLAIPQPVQDEITRPALRGDEFSASIAGDLKTFQLPDVLEFLRLQNKSGSLVVSSRAGAGVVRLARGRVTSASAPGVKRLGEALVEQRIIGPVDLEAALAHQQTDQEESLGTLLLRDGVVDGPQLSDAVERQVLTSLEQMLSWTEGAFSFHQGEDKEPSPISFNIQELVLKVMKIRDERKHQRAR